MPATTCDSVYRNSASVSTPSTRHQGIIVHALHKSATMFLHSFFQELSARSNRAFFSPNLPDDGRFPDLDDLPSRFCQCPVRSFKIDNELERSARIQHIFHLRDPRDILVSEYFSIAFIHPLQTEKLRQRRAAAQKMTVDEYVLHQPDFSESPLELEFVPLMQRVRDPHETDIFVKYETMVTRFHQWALAVVKPFGFRSSQWTTAGLAWKYRREFKPGRNSQGKLSHKRQITPGDFRRKLAPETVEVLNRRFATILDAFAYEP